MLNVDGWTDGRTDGRKLARLCLPAKAGATKTYINMTYHFSVPPSEMYRKGSIKTSSFADIKLSKSFAYHISLVIR